MKSRYQRCTRLVLAISLQRKKTSTFEALFSDINAVFKKANSGYKAGNNQLVEAHSTGGKNDRYPSVCKLRGRFFLFKKKKIELRYILYKYSPADQIVRSLAR